jgi:hypothetical protein
MYHYPRTLSIHAYFGLFKTPLCVAQGCILSGDYPSFDTISQPQVAVRRHPAAIKTLQLSCQYVVSFFIISCLCWDETVAPDSAIPDCRNIVAGANQDWVGQSHLSGRREPPW